MECYSLEKFGPPIRRSDRTKKTSSGFTEHYPGIDFCGHTVRKRKAEAHLQEFTPSCEKAGKPLADYQTHRQPGKEKDTAEPASKRPRHQTKPQTSTKTAVISEPRMETAPAEPLVIADKSSSSENASDSGEPSIEASLPVASCAHRTSSGKPRSLFDRAKQEAATIGNGVFIAPSTTGGGLGLFAGKDFKGGDFVTLYDGTQEDISKDQRRELLSDYESWSHAAALSRYELIQGLKEPASGRGGGSFANHGFGGYHSPNVKFRVLEKNLDKQLYLQALVFIKKGDEIFVNYGHDYWNRFQDTFPDLYESIFAAKLREAVKDMDSSLLQDLINIKAVTEFLTVRNVPIPNLPELKAPPVKWNDALSRYALFKIGAVEGDHLSLGTLRLLKEDSNEYFIAVAQFILKREDFKNHTAMDWNFRDNSPAIPQNGVFNKSITAWSGFHYNIFAGLYCHSRFDTEENALMSTIRMLDPSHSMYEQLLSDYIFRFLGIAPNNLDTPDLSISGKKKTKLAILSNKLSKSPAVPLHSVAGHKMPLSEQWSVEYLREFLIRKGVKLEGKRFYPNQINDLIDDEEMYNRAFLIFCRERSCNFRSIMKVTERTNIVCSPIPGVVFENKNCNLSALFMQYIHRAGFDCPEVLNAATNGMLCNCLDMMLPQYKGEVSAETLLALIVTGSISEQKKMLMVCKYKDRLPGYETMSTRAAKQQLKQKGEELRAQYSALPTLSSTDD